MITTRRASERHGATLRWTKRSFPNAKQGLGIRLGIGD
jgi:hypothetical protein